MEKVNLSANLVDAVLSYLSKRPFDEVVYLIGGLQKEVQEQRQAQEVKQLPKT